MTKTPSNSHKNNLQICQQLDELTEDQQKQLFSTDNEDLIRNLIAKVMPTDMTGLDNKYIDSSGIKTKNKLQAIITGNGIEAMIAAQMVAVHNLQLECAAHARHAPHAELCSSYVNMTTKLSNAFIQQTRLLRKIQGKEEQKVTVEHVNIHDGGQAIVGNITNNTGGAKR